MALSNWDTLALTHEGKSCNGVFVSPLGVTVEFYKNWVYVRDPQAWRSAGGWAEPTVMEVQHGELRYQDVHIQAWRGPQRGIYAVVSAWNRTTDLYTGMVGCGVYGYKQSNLEDEDDGWVGVLPTSVVWFQGRLTKTYKGTCLPWLKGFRLDGATRFNQGDAYFAKALGVETPATPPGESGPTVLEQMMEEEG